MTLNMLFIFLMFVLLLLTFLFALVVCLVALYSHIKSGINEGPYVANDSEIIAKTLKMAGTNKNSTLIDLGSGDGRVLITAVKYFDVKKAIGYEIAPWPRIVSTFRVKALKEKKDRITILNQNLLTAKLPENSIVYMYLMPRLPKSLVSKLDYAIKNKNVTVVSPVFKIGDLKPSKTETAYHKGFRKKVNIYLYR